MVLSGKCEFLNMKIQNFQIQSFSLGARDGFTQPIFYKRLAASVCKSDKIHLKKQWSAVTSLRK